MIPGECRGYEERAEGRSDTGGATAPGTGAVGGRGAVGAGREDHRDRRWPASGQSPGGEVAQVLARGRHGGVAVDGGGVGGAVVASAVGAPGTRVGARAAGARLGGWAG